jgi:hypothetical protein
MSTRAGSEHPAPECARCRVPLEEGFLIDAAHYGVPYAGQWASGARKQGFFGVHLAGRRKLPVTAYRCPGCARLELFAFPIARRSDG